MYKKKPNKTDEKNRIIGSKKTTLVWAHQNTQT